MEQTRIHHIKQSCSSFTTCIEQKDGSFWYASLEEYAGDCIALVFIIGIRGTSDICTSGDERMTDILGN